MQYTKLNWRNGLPYSERFDDIYYSSDEVEIIPEGKTSAEGVSGKNVSGADISGATVPGEAEFKHVFFKSNGLPERWSDAPEFIIAELGFGSGLNCMLTIREWLKRTQNKAGSFDQHECLHYIAIEKYPLSPESIHSLLSQYSELDSICTEIINTYPPAVQGSHSRSLFGNRVMIHYKFMDAHEALINENHQVDAWYLDGFSPAKNADMWSSQLFELIAENSHDKTTCSTYTAAGFVKRNLQAVGFEVQKVPGFGKKRDMLVAKVGELQRSFQQLNSYKFTDKPWFVPAKRPVYKRKCATIIGAGIAGLCVAHSLIQRGWMVTIIDQHGEPAMEASSNPAAIVYPRLAINNDSDTQFNVEAYCYALHFLNTLQKKTPKRFWFNCGLLQKAEAEKIIELIKKFDFNENFISINKRFTNINCTNSSKLNSKDDMHSYLDFKDAGVVFPKNLCEILTQECGEHLKIINATVDSIEPVDNHWRCNAVDGLIHTSEILIIASGVKLNNLSPAVNFPVESVRGQALVLSETSQSNKIVKAMNAGVYLTPLINRQHFLGATYSRDNDSIEIDELENEKLLSAANNIYSGMFTAADIDRTWIGFRATSKDRSPIVGAIADRLFYEKEYADIKHGKQGKTYPPAKHMSGLYISAAHGSRGFTTSFLCAELIASQIEGSPAPVSKAVADSLNPSRFVVNDLKRGF